MTEPGKVSRQGKVSDVANQVEDHPALEAGARVGYAVSGVLHLMIAWTALQIAWLSSGKSADQSGALQALAGNSLGRVTLWVVVAGFLALGVWQLANALTMGTGRESAQWADLAKGIAKGILYLALAWTSFGFTRGQPTSSKAQSADFTATLLRQTGGRLLVLAIGLSIIGVGGYHMMKGWTKKFLQDLRDHPGALATRAGMVGYIAKGIALAVVGILFVIAAASNESSKSTGLDGALRSLRQQVVGLWLLTAVALGIAAFGLYCLARAKHARV